MLGARRFKQLRTTLKSIYIRSKSRPNEDMMAACLFGLPPILGIGASRFCVR